MAVVEDWRTGPLSDLPAAQYTIEVLAGAARALTELDVEAAAEPAEDALTQRTAARLAGHDPAGRHGRRAQPGGSRRPGGRAPRADHPHRAGRSAGEPGDRHPAPGAGACRGLRRGARPRRRDSPLGSTPVLPVRAHAQATVRAILLEAAGDHEEAAAEYSDAVARWAGFGNRLEQAYALLGLGRSRLAYGDPAGRQSLVEARAQFAAMGATVRVAECDELLATVVRLTLSRAAGPGSRDRPCPRSGARRPRPARTGRA